MSNKGGGGEGNEVYHEDISETKGTEASMEGKASALGNTGNQRDRDTMRGEKQCGDSAVCKHAGEMTEEVHEAGERIAAPVNDRACIGAGESERISTVVYNDHAADTDGHERKYRGGGRESILCGNR